MFWPPASAQHKIHHYFCLQLKNCYILQTMFWPPASAHHKFHHYLCLQLDYCYILKSVLAACLGQTQNPSLPLFKTQVFLSTTQNTLFAQLPRPNTKSITTFVYNPSIVKYYTKYIIWPPASLQHK